MSKEECDLIDALARQERPAGDRVPEAMHRRHGPVRHQDRIPMLVALVQNREGGLSLGLDGFDLRGTQGTADVALTERPA